MTYQDLLDEIQRLPHAQKRALFVLLAREFAAEGVPTYTPVVGILRSDGAPPTDTALRAAYVDYLAEKYA